MKTVWLSAIGWWCIGILAPAVFAAPTKLRVSVTVLKDTTKAKACLKFKELLEAKSKGEFQVEVHAEGKLYRDREELDALQLGAVEMIVPSFVKFDMVGVSEFSVFYLPFLFKDLREVHAITDGHIGQQLFKLLEPKGIKGLAYWDLGFNHFHANKPIHLPSDMKGLKFKLIRGRVFNAVAKALQTQPILLPRGPILEGYEKHQVEASTSPIHNFYMDGYPAFQKHLTLTAANFHGFVVATSLKFWNSLSQDAQMQVDQALQEATRYERELSEKDNAEALEKLKGGGLTQVYTPTEAELKKWKEALLPVRDQFKREKEGVYLERILEALGTRY